MNVKKLSMWNMFAVVRTMGVPGALRAVSLLVLLAGPVSITAAESAQGKTVWNQWRGPQRTGASPDVPAKLEGLQLLWKQPLESENAAGIVVANGFLVVACHVGNEDQLRCYRAETGELLWTDSTKNTVEIDYGSGPRATPLIHDGRVYSLSAVGNFVCSDLAKGTVIWKLDFQKNFSGEMPIWGFCSSPLIVDGKLIVSTMGSQAGIAALDPATGKVLWQTPGKGQAYSSYICGKFGGVSQLVGYDGAAIAGWDPATGKQLWSVTPKKEGDYNVGTPVDVDGKLLLATENNGARLYAFGADGKIIPEPVAINEELGPDMATPVYCEGLIFCSGNSEFMCLDKATLKNNWVEFKDSAVNTFTMLVFGNGRLLSLSGNGDLALLTPSDKGYKVIDKKKVCGATMSYPALADGKLYVRDNKMIYCYAEKKQK